MKRILVLLFLLLPSIAFAQPQKPPINGVAGPTTSAQFGSIITNPFGVPASGRVPFIAPCSNGVLVTNGSSLPLCTPTTTFSSTVYVDQYYSGSGTYDAAFAAAIAACPSAGCNVYLNAITYTTASSVTFSRGNIRFQCAVWNACTILNTSTTSDIFTVNPTSISTSLTTNGTATATVASAAGLAIGMQIQNASVGGGTTITNIVGTTLTLSVSATGSGTSAATFGNYYFNIFWDGVVFAKQSASTAGCDINASNIGYSGVSNSRFYGNLTAWKHLCLTSVVNFDWTETRSDNPINAHITMAGVSGANGTFNGSVNGFVMNGSSNMIAGGHGSTVSPLGHGAIEVGDYTGGLFFNNPQIFQHKGYAIRFTGTSAGAAANQNSLVFIMNPNVESDFNGSSGGIYATWYNHVNVTGGWLTGNGVPAINWDSNSAGLNVAGAQLVSNGTSSSAVRVAGSIVNLTGNDIQSYNPGVGFGVALESGAAQVNVAGGSMAQFATAVKADGASNMQATIGGVQFGNNTVDIDPAVVGWALATIGINSNALGTIAAPLKATTISAAGDVTLSKSQNAPDSFVCTNGSAGASSVCRLFLQTGTANSSISIGLNDAAGAPFFSTVAALGVPTSFTSFDTHNFTSQSGVNYVTFNSTGLTAAGVIRGNTGFSANGTAGTSATITVRNSAGTGTCTITYTFGLVTASTC